MHINSIIDYYKGIQKYSSSDFSRVNIDLLAEKSTNEKVSTIFESKDYNNYNSAKITVGRRDDFKKKIALEDQFEESFQKVDTDECCSFFDFLSPNEAYPENVIPHLDLAKNGVLVSTGTERSFFNLAQIDQKKCEGLICIDINQKAIAYVRFNTLLLRITKTREEYIKLSSDIKDGNSDKHLDTDQLIKDRISLISIALENSDLNEKIKCYYRENLSKFGSLYLKERNLWRNKDSFKACWYHLNDTQFAQLQSYAKSGNIIAVVGDINKLSFLKMRKISIVDTSNIKNYSILDFQSPGDNFRPRIIHTCPPFRETVYKSYQFNPITDEVRNEITRIINIMCADEMCGIAEAIRTKFATFSTAKPINTADDIGPIYSQNNLLELQKILLNNYIQISGLGYIEFSEKRIEKLNKADPTQIEELIKHEKIELFLPRLVSHWPLLKPSIHLAFSKVNGWKEEFEKQFAGPYLDLNRFLQMLEEANLLQEFKDNFGADRLSRIQYLNTQSDWKSNFSK